MIEHIKMALVFAALMASGVHGIILMAGFTDVPFTCDVGFLVCGFIPSLIFVRSNW